MDESTFKQIERARYNQRSLEVLAGRVDDRVGVSGAAAIPIELRAPYVHYESLIRAHAAPSVRVLDLCCGDGLHSLTAAACGAEVTATDIAEQTLKLAARRASRSGLAIRFVPADAEAIPFPPASFDVITCAGSLSYLDMRALLRELQRVLQPGGAFIFVDSLNHNPFYRLNRWCHCQRGRRSLATLRRMPTLRTLATIRTVFPDLQVTYHGIFSFVAPMLRVFGRARVARWLDGADQVLPSLHWMAFKVTGCGHLPYR